MSELPEYVKKAITCPKCGLVGGAHWGWCFEEIILPEPDLTGSPFWPGYRHE